MSSAFHLHRKPVEQPYHGRRVPLSSSARSEDCTAVEFFRNRANASDPYALHVCNDASQVLCALLSASLDHRHGFVVAHLLIPDCASAVGIAQALHVRMTALPCGGDALSGDRQRGLGTLTDQPCLKLSYRSHLGEQEASHGPRRNLWQVTEDKVNAAGHQLTEKVNVPGEPVELRKDQCSTYGLGVRESGRELRPHY
jgi:hypothetical protein